MPYSKAQINAPTSAARRTPSRATTIAIVMGVMTEMAATTVTVATIGMTVMMTMIVMAVVTTAMIDVTTMTGGRTAVIVMTAGQLCGVATDVVPLSAARVRAIRCTAVSGALPK